MERAPLRQAEVTIAGIRSHLIEGGPATAEEAVVFVHGSPGSSRDWEELAAQVSTFGRAIALDMPRPPHNMLDVDGQSGVANPLVNLQADSYTLDRGADLAPTMFLV